VVAIVGAPFTVRVNCLELLPEELVAAMVTVAAAIAVGVPLSRPVDAFNVNPVGSVPLVTAQAIAGLPEAANICAYALPVWPDGNGETVVITGAELTLRLICLDAVPKALVARTVRVLVPVAVGVPLMSPVALFNANPVGKAPRASAQEMGVVPEAVRACV
jgi:hypothetical protein